MKSIMISIQPQWVSKILNKEKLVEIRKTKPKCELPCKVYIYCTKQEFGVKRVWYYTDSSDYQFYGGWRYELNKSNNGIYWLVLNNTEKIEV